jgi:hypothetical protein
MAQPSDQDIDNVVSFTGFTDRALIASALKVALTFPISSYSEPELWSGHC